MPVADMTAWSAQVVQRLKALLNVREISDQAGDDDDAGDGDDAKLKRAAIIRNRNPQDARIASDALAVLAFSGYQDWYDFDDDEWTKNCLSQVLDEDQHRFLVSALTDASLTDFTAAVQAMAGPYRGAWQRAAENEAAESASAASAAGLYPAENTESWEYSRTPGTRYYIFHDGKYLYSDDKDAPLAGWASAEARDDQAAARATEWETGSGVFYTSYENPALAGGVEHVFGQSKDGPWKLTRSRAEQLLAEARRSQAPTGVTGAGSPVEPYFDTGHFTRFDNNAYTFGETAGTRTWYSTYADLLDAVAARDGARAGEPAASLAVAEQACADHVVPAITEFISEYSDLEASDDEMFAVFAEVLKELASEETRKS